MIPFPLEELSRQPKAIFVTLNFVPGALEPSPSGSNVFIDLKYPIRMTEGLPDLAWGRSKGVHERAMLVVCTSLGI